MIAHRVALRIWYDKAGLNAKGWDPMTAKTVRRHWVMVAMRDIPLMWYLQLSIIIPRTKMSVSSRLFINCPM